MGDYADNNETKQNHDDGKTTRELMEEALHEQPSYFTRMAQPCQLCKDTRVWNGQTCPACKGKHRLGR